MALRGDWIVHDRFVVLVAFAALVPLLLAFRHNHALLAAVVTGAAALAAVPPLVAIIEAVFGAGRNADVGGHPMGTVRCGHCRRPNGPAAVEACDGCGRHRSRALSYGRCSADRRPRLSS